MKTNRKVPFFDYPTLETCKLEIGNVHFVDSPRGQPTQHGDKTSAQGNDF